MEKKQQKRLHCEKKIVNRFFQLKIGTVNKKNPQIIYFEGRGFIYPFEDIILNEKLGKKLKNKLNFIIQNKLIDQELFENKFILDLQIAENRVKINKKTYIHFQFLLKQKELVLINIKDIKANTEDMVNKIIEEFTQYLYDNGFLVFLKKNEEVLEKN